MSGNYTSGEYIVAAESTDQGDDVVVVMLRRDPDHEDRFRSLLWKASERPVPASGKVTPAGRMHLPMDAAHALREALIDATGANPQLAFTIHGLAGQRALITATEGIPPEVLRERYSETELAALAHLAHHLMNVLTNAAGRPRDEADRETQVWHASDDVVEGRVMPPAFTPQGQPVPPPTDWTPGPIPPPIPNQ